MHNWVKWLRRIPVFGVYLRYLNLYVGKGELRYFNRAAPLDLWLERFLVEVVSCFLVTGIIWILIVYLDQLDGVGLQGLVLSVFPSLLGFGIGVFALIFVLPDELMNELDRGQKKSGLGSHMMISDMAYPLVFLALAIMLSVILGLLLSSPVADFVELFLFVYGLTLVFDLIGVIAASALASRTNKVRKVGNQRRRDLLAKLRRKL